MTLAEESLFPNTCLRRFYDSVQADGTSTSRDEEKAFFFVLELILKLASYPVNLQMKKSASKKHYRAHQNESKACFAKYYEHHKDKMKSSFKEYNEAHEEKLKLPLENIMRFMKIK